ncbi:MAG: glycine cleavage system protein GcvH [bacterium]
MVPEDLKYTKTHEWVRMEGGQAVIGITFHAQEELGDVVHVDLPKIDTYFKKGEVFGTIESVKASSDLFMPISGTVSEVNHTLIEQPEFVNTDAYGEGWMITVEIENPSELVQLLSAPQYEKSIV